MNIDNLLSYRPFDLAKVERLKSVDEGVPDTFKLWVEDMSTRQPAILSIQIVVPEETLIAMDIEVPPEA